jgi:hypothetical protein
MEISSFSAIETESIYRVHRVVWCNLATIDTLNRPRSRILHPIWEGSSGWINPRSQTLIAKHLAHNPYVSLARTADKAKPTYTDCKAEWIDGTQQKQRIWDIFKNAPPSFVYDPITIYKGADHPGFGPLKLTPCRSELNACTLNLRNHLYKTPLKPDARPQEAETHSANSRWKHIVRYPFLSLVTRSI